MIDVIFREGSLVGSWGYPRGLTDTYVRGDTGNVKYLAS
jgi:hypothetical protein